MFKIIRGGAALLIAVLLSVGLLAMPASASTRTQDLMHIHSSAADYDNQPPGIVNPAGWPWLYNVRSVGIYNGSYELHGHAWTTTSSYAY